MQLTMLHIFSLSSTNISYAQSKQYLGYVGLDVTALL